MTTEQTTDLKKVCIELAIKTLPNPQPDADTTLKEAKKYYDWFIEHFPDRKPSVAQ